MAGDGGGRRLSRAGGVGRGAGAGSFRTATVVPVVAGLEGVAVAEGGDESGRGTSGEGEPIEGVDQIGHLRRLSAVGTENKAPFNGAAPAASAASAASAAAATTTGAVGVGAALICDGIEERE